MIGTTTTVLGTAGLVALGLWAEDKNISMKFIVGTGIYASAIAILGEANQEFAAKFALTVFVLAILLYGPGVLNKLGLTNQGKGILGGLGDAIGRAVGSTGAGGSKVGGVAGSAVR